LKDEREINGTVTQRQRRRNNRGFRLPALGSRLPGSGSRLPAFGFRLPEPHSPSDLGTSDLRPRTSDFGLRTSRQIAFGAREWDRWGAARIQARFRQSKGS